MSFVREWADHVDGGPSPEQDPRLQDPANYHEVLEGDYLENATHGIYVEVVEDGRAVHYSMRAGLIGAFGSTSRHGADFVRDIRNLKYELRAVGLSTCPAEGERPG